MGAVRFSLERPGPDELRRLWTGLEARADVNFYLSWAWIGAWLAQAGPPDLVLVGRAGDEAVCLGLFRRKLVRRHGFVRSRTLFLHQTGNEEEDIIFIEYNDFLTDRRFGDLTPAAIAWLRANQQAAGGFDEIDLGGMVEQKYRSLQAAGCRTHAHAHKTTAFVDLEAVRAGGGDYLATLSSNTRYQIRRAAKIYEARGPLELHAAASVAEAAAFFDEMGALHEAAWREKGEGGAWRFPFLVRFHRRLIETAFPEGGIEIVRISCGGAPIGYIHCLVRDGWIGSYLSGFAYEEDNKVKPGLVSFWMYIEEKLKNGGEVLDFLAGDHRYKTSLGERGPDMFWFRVQERRPLLMLEDALRGAKHLAGRVRGKPRKPA